MMKTVPVFDDSTYMYLLDTVLELQQRARSKESHLKRDRVCEKGAVKKMNFMLVILNEPHSIMR